MRKLLQRLAHLTIAVLAGNGATMVGQTSPPYTLENARILARNGQRGEALKILEDRLAVEP